MHIEADKLRTDLRRLRAQLVRATDKQTRRALAESMLQTEGRLHRVEEATENR
jgi:hypothetical protein